MVAAAELPLTFERFFAEEYPRLVPMLHALTGDRGRAEDVAQEALVRAHRDWERIRDYERPGAWTRRVAINLASNASRSARREEHALRRVGPAGGIEPSAMLTPADEQLWGLVRTLPEQQRAVVVLHYVEDLSVADVAQVLDISDGTVKTHLSRARAALAAQLADPTATNDDTTKGGDRDG